MSDGVRYRLFCAGRRSTSPTDRELEAGISGAGTAFQPETTPIATIAGPS